MQAWIRRPQTWPMRRRPDTAPSGSTSARVLLDPSTEDSQLGQTVNNYGLLGGDRLSMAQGRIAGDRQSSGSGDRGAGILCSADAERRALYPRRQLSSLAEGDAGDAGGRAGAFSSRPSRFRCRRAKSRWARTECFRWPEARWPRWASSHFPPARNSRRRAPIVTLRRAE